jgi:2-methylcitrate dehydratase PrpD
MTNNVTRRLAEFLAASQWQDIPDEVRNEAKRTILNFVGTALGGCRDEAVELAVRALRPFFGPAGDRHRPQRTSGPAFGSISQRDQRQCS